MSRTDDSGMTLIELLMAMAISVLLIGVVTSAFIMSVQVNEQSKETLAESRDAQLTAAYLPGDLLSAGSGGVDTTVTADTADTACASPAPGTHRILKLTWQDGATHFVAEYRARDTGGGQWQLVRYACQETDPSALSAAEPETQIIARNLRPVVEPAVDLPVVEQIDRQIRIRITDATGYTYTLGGTRRTPLTVTTPPPAQAMPTLTPLLPQLDSAELRGDAAGEVYVEVSFTDAVPAGCATQFTVASDEAWRGYEGPAGIATGGSTARLPLVRAEGKQPVTSAGDLAVSLTGDSTGCAVQSFENAPVDDRAAPVIVDVIASGGSARKIESGDSLSVLFSEPVTNAPKQLDMRFTGGNSDQHPDVVSLAGLFAGNASLGLPSYSASKWVARITGQVTSGPTPTTLTALLTIADCGSDKQCLDGEDMTPATGSGALTFTQVGTLEDEAKNSLTGLGVAAAGRAIDPFEGF